MTVVSTAKEELSMPVSKSRLRACARAALEERLGYSVQTDRGRGYVPGARLTATKEAKKIKVAVRTSLDREIGLMRDPHGNWRTIPTVDMVVVVVPMVGDPKSVEVFGFDPEVLKREFDAALAAQLKRHPDLKLKAPIFVSIDGPAGQAKSAAIAGLKTKSQWVEVLLLNSVNPQLNAAGGFIDRVKREFADLVGVDVSKVSVEFHING
jgi:hypothetical protein